MTTWEGMALTARFRALSGEDIRFMQCDDSDECADINKAGPVLKASNKATPKHSDGWCVGPIDSETGVKIEITGVKKMLGVNFLDSTSSVADFVFEEQKALLEKPGNSVDEDGLFSGDLPEIIIKPGGISKA